MPETPQIIVTFARPEESRPFRRRLAECVIVQIDGTQVLRARLHGRPIACLHTGIGPAAAAAVLPSILSAFRPSLLLAAGFAGALDPTLAPGDIIREERPLPATDSAIASNATAPRLISRPTPAETVAEKSALFRETRASAIDMETDTIAAACAAAGIPMLALRAISDTATEPLPVPFPIWYDLARQRPRPLALLAWLALHPTRIPPFTRFVRRLPRIAESLANALTEAISNINGTR